jgi:hypothetical protein
MNEWMNGWADEWKNGRIVVRVTERMLGERKWGNTISQMLCRSYEIRSIFTLTVIYTLLTYAQGDSRFFRL